MSNVMKMIPPRGPYRAEEKPLPPEVTRESIDRTMANLAAELKDHEFRVWYEDGNIFSWAGSRKE